jgi:AAA+ ATPase superfamily predicted ATPase
MSDASENILDTFSDIASEKFNNVRFQNWDNFFDFLYSISKDNRFIVVIDEFQYLTAVLKSWPTILQRHWEKLKKTKIFLVLSGSLISSIYRIAIGYGAALYGRKTAEMNIKPLNFMDTRNFFKTDIYNIIKIYMILGGVPRYLEEFDSGNIYNNIKKKILNKNSFLYNEPLNLLHEEFKDLTSYFAVLDVIGSGATTFNEISLKSRIAQNKLSKVLDVLIGVELIASEESIIKNNVRNKHIYYIKDNLFNFWFKFVYPFRSLLEMNNEQAVLANIKNEINTLFGQRFEFLARDLLLHNQDKLPFAISYIGRSWGKLKNKVGNNPNYEFDVVIQDAQKYYAGIFEVKYKKLGYIDACEILQKMEEIYKNIGVNSRPLFRIIAVSIENKEFLRKNGYYAFDLNDA